MSKVTSKLQLTIPKRVAERYGITPGSEVTWVEAGDVIHLVPGRKPPDEDLHARRMRSFEAATKRWRTYKKANELPGPGRGWTREEIYGNRGFPR